jgi:Ca2+-binding EF-hand superfamily protein
MEDYTIDPKYFEIAKKYIDLYDKDKDGNLSRKELKTFYETIFLPKQGAKYGLSKANYDSWYSNLDRDGDGTINMAEFADYLDGIKWEE